MTQQACQLQGSFQMQSSPERWELISCKPGWQCLMLYRKSLSSGSLDTGACISADKQMAALLLTAALTISCTTMHLNLLPVLSAGTLHSSQFHHCKSHSLHLLTWLSTNAGLLPCIEGQLVRAASTQGICPCWQPWSAGKLQSSQRHHCKSQSLHLLTCQCTAVALQRMPVGKQGT